MELVLEDGKKIYMEESFGGVVARLFDENGILIEQTGFTANFLYNILFGDFSGRC